MKIVEIHVKEGTQAMCLSLGSSPSKSMLMVRVFDPNHRFIGTIMSGFFFPTIMFVSSHQATLNALKHKPLPGVYKLYMVWLLNDDKHDYPDMHVTFNQDALHVLEEYGTEILQERSLWQGQSRHQGEGSPRYYKGDLHGHTFLSDGALDHSQANKVLMSQELDFMAFTEHNLVAMGSKAFDCLIIPSFELTLPLGHINIHGLKHPDIYEHIASIEDFALNPYLSAFYEHCHISVNHPFLKPWHFQMPDLDLNHIHSIEIMCDPTYPGSDKATEQAIAFFDYLWAHKRVIFAVGGSDAHLGIGERYEDADAPSLYGDPATLVYAKALSSEALIASLKKGSSYIARGVSLDFDFVAGESLILPGECIEDFMALSHMRLRMMPAFPGFDKAELSVIYKGRCILKREIDSNQDVVIPFDSDIWEQDTTWHWLRFELRDHHNKLIGFINPIYSGRKSQGALTWGTLMEAFQKT